jgi:hypothetical protein
MSANVQSFELAKQALDEVKDLAPGLKEALDLGKEQASTRDGVIDTINNMCDALQLASDLVSEKLSAKIVEYNQTKDKKEDAMISYFGRLVNTFSENNIWILLHEGKVCGELHKLGDRFETPFSPEAMGGLSFLENVMTFFRRSSSMSLTLHCLLEGERQYLRDIAAFLGDLRARAEAATGLWGQREALRGEGDAIVQLMRNKRQILVEQVRQLRLSADASIEALH